VFEEKSVFLGVWGGDLFGLVVLCCLRVLPVKFNVQMGI